MPDIMPNPNSFVIKVLCTPTSIDNNVNPYSSVEWSQLASYLHMNGLDPADLLLLNSNDEATGYLKEHIRSRIGKLFGFERLRILSKLMYNYRRVGIHIVTRADWQYPQTLKTNLHADCPPLLYCIGDIRLLCDSPSLILSSRKIDKAAKDYATDLAKCLALDNHTVAIADTEEDGISGTVINTVINHDGKVIMWVNGNMLSHIKQSNIINAIESGKLLIVSAVEPTSNHTSQNIALGDKCLYAMSERIIVIKVNDGFGTVWRSLTDNFSDYSDKLYCVNDSDYAGNMHLIEMGAKPLNEYIF